MQTISNWTYASFFFGLLTISFIIWNRLIRVRLPRELFIANEYDFTFFIVFSLTIIFGIIFLYYFLNLIKYLPRNPGRIIKFLNSMVQKLEHFMIYQFFDIVNYILNYRNFEVPL
jgi:TRAP-type C4-dicarboxylate transport system permease small subunit